MKMSSESNLSVLQHEVRRDWQAKYYHRAHGVLLVLRGLSCRQAGELIGDSPRSLQYWVKRYQSFGLGGLSEKERKGRPAKLEPEDLERLHRDLARDPRELGLKVENWDAKTLAVFLHQKYQVIFSVRQCQRLLWKLREAAVSLLVVWVCYWGAES